MRQFLSSSASVIKTLSIGFALACALSSTSANAFGSFDGGGRVGDYLDYVGQANASGARVELDGVCASACTMKLGARNACVSSGSQFWFHAARNPDGRVNALATMIMMQQYPAGIRAWVQARGALNSTALTSMDGAQAIALGMRSCERPTVEQANYTPMRSAAPVTVRACFASPSAMGGRGLSQSSCQQPAPEAATASFEASFAPPPPTFRHFGMYRSIRWGGWRHAANPSFGFSWPTASAEVASALPFERHGR